MDKNFNLRKKVIEITLRYTQKQNALMQSFLLICHAIVHSSASKELEKTVLDFENILNPHNLQWGSSLPLAFVEILASNCIFINNKTFRWKP